MTVIIAVLLQLWAWSLPPGALADTGVPPFYLEKLGTPKLMQSLPAAKLPYGGEPYCGPVAVSNSMIWLGSNGYERLSLPHADRPEVQGQIAETLGSRKYLKTTYADGTLIRSMLTGVDRYVRDRGYGVKSLLYEGWEPHPKQFDTGVERPELDWIKKGILGNSAVWLKIGWYKFDKKRDYYRRFAGHFVTLVGYGKDENGQENPNILIIHDPAPRAGAEFRHDYVAVTRLSHGEIHRERRFPDISADGFYLLGGGLKIKEGADAGILEGTIVLTME